MKREKLLKILQHATNGTGAEKNVARELLDRKLAELGLTEADLLSERRDFHEFNYRNANEKRLIFQVTAKLTGRNVRMWRRGKKLFLQLTDSENVTISVALSILRPALNQAIEDCFLAFMMRNDLLVDPDADDDSRPDKDTIEKYQRAMHMAQGIDYTGVRQLVGSGAECKGLEG